MVGARSFPHRLTMSLTSSLSGGAVGGGEVDADHLPAPGDAKLRHSFEQGDGFVRRHRVLGGVPGFGRFNAVLRKKLLRAFAAGSAGAVIPPFEVLAHSVSPLGEVGVVGRGSWCRGGSPGCPAGAAAYGPWKIRSRGRACRATAAVGWRGEGG